MLIKALFGQSDIEQFVTSHKERLIRQASLFFACDQLPSARDVQIKRLHEIEEVAGKPAARLNIEQAKIYLLPDVICDKINTLYNPHLLAHPAAKLQHYFHLYLEFILLHELSHAWHVHKIGKATFWELIAQARLSGLKSPDRSYEIFANNMAKAMLIDHYGLTGELMATVAILMHSGTPAEQEISALLARLA